MCEWFFDGADWEVHLRVWVYKGGYGEECA